MDGTKTVNFTQTLCLGTGALTYNPAVVTAGIPNGTTLAITPIPTGTGIPWCGATTTFSTLASKTSSAGGSAEAPRLLWEAVVGGILGAAVVL